MEIPEKVVDELESLKDAVQDRYGPDVDVTWEGPYDEPAYGLIVEVAVKFDCPYDPNRSRTVFGMMEDIGMLPPLYDPKHGCVNTPDGFDVTNYYEIEE